MKTDTLDRRLRWERPNPRVKRVQLTEADYLTFEAIDRHGPLPTNLIYEFTRHLRKDYTHLQNRLTEFYNGDEQGPLLIRPPQQFAGFEARYQHLVYDLSPRARMALAERGTLGAHSPRRSDPFLHQLMGACVAASIELAAPSKVIGYVPREEILKDLKSEQPMALSIGANKLIPDDLFGLRFKDGWTRYCAVEIDRNTESIERKNLDYNTIGKKVQNYVAVLENNLFKSHWGIANLGILIVTTNATHARNMLDHIEKNAGRFADRFAIQVVTEFGTNWRVPKEPLSRLLNEPWTTVSGTKDISQS